MVDRSSFSGNADGGNDLKAKDFVGKRMELVVDRVITVDYPANEDQPANSKTALHFVGKEKRVVLNHTNNRAMCEAYGNDDEGWIGKRIALTVADYTAKNFGYGWIVTPLDIEFDEDDDIPFSFLLPLLPLAYVAQNSLNLWVSAV